jgi:type II secretory pathway pseudopilin PulG
MGKKQARGLAFNAQPGSDPLAMRTLRPELSECPEAPRSRTFPGADVGADAGITLVEIMAVLLVPAILPAIAIPTFLGVTTSADHRVTRSNHSIALIAAQSVYSTHGRSRANVTMTALQPAERVCTSQQVLRRPRPRSPRPRRRTERAS